MAFITSIEYGICLSTQGETGTVDCGVLIREGVEKIIKTDADENIILEGTCGEAASKFNCDQNRETVDEGKYVKITNVCTLPITITKLTNSDPVRFSLFEYPKYLNIGGEYNTENTDELPIKLEPQQSVKINTFFHPTFNELSTGTAGFVEDLHNQDVTPDKWVATIGIYPGFRVINCSDDENECNASFQLVGELLCEAFPDTSWMDNKDNFIEPKFSDFGDVTNDYCIPTVDGVFREFIEVQESAGPDPAPDYLGPHRLNFSGKLLHPSTLTIKEDGTIESYTTMTSGSKGYGDPSGKWKREGDDLIYYDYFNLPYMFGPTAYRTVRIPGWFAATAANRVTISGTWNYGTYQNTPFQIYQPQ